MIRFYIRIVVILLYYTETMTSFTPDCEDVFHSVESVYTHFIMDWKNALSQFEPFLDNTFLDNTFMNNDDEEVSDENASERDEQEYFEPDTEDFCIFQFEL